MTTARAQKDVPNIFRVTLEVSNIDQAAAFYAKLLGDEGKRHPGARHYFDCGGVILAVLDPTQGGAKPQCRSLSRGTGEGGGFWGSRTS